MAQRKIVKTEDGNDILRSVCRPVEKITPRIQQLLDDMVETMRKANGCGLAAPQVGILRRICVVETEPGEVIELINPEIIERTGEQRELEGCLSLPGRSAVTKRPMSVTVKALDRNGNEIKVSGSGLKARAFCHEIDHLDGVLFIDNATELYNDVD